MTSVSDLEIKDFVDLCKVEFLYISGLFIQPNRDSCIKDIAGGVNIYFYMCTSLLAPLCAMHVYL